MRVTTNNIPGGYVIPPDVSPLPLLLFGPAWAFGLSLSPALTSQARGHASPAPMRASRQPCCQQSHSISFSKLFSTGWGRYRYRPAPQMGRIKLILRATPKFSGKSKTKPCAALNARHMLTPSTDQPIILADSPKYGVICPRHPTSSAVSWPPQRMTLSLLRRRASQ
jgi:hypothetical protein